MLKKSEIRNLRIQPAPCLCLTFLTLPMESKKVRIRRKESHERFLRKARPLFFASRPAITTTKPYNPWVLRPVRARDTRANTDARRISGICRAVSARIAPACAPVHTRIGLAAQYAHTHMRMRIAPQYARTRACKYNHQPEPKAAASQYARTRLQIQGAPPAPATKPNTQRGRATRE